MKRIVLAVLVFLFVAWVAQTGVADIKIDDGELLVPAKNWEATGVKVSPQARQYSEATEEAYQNPGKIIVAKKNVKTEMVDLFHYHQEVIADPGVVYNETRGEIYTVSKAVGVENHFTPYIIFWGISVFPAIVILALLKFGRNISILSIIFSGILPALLIVTTFPKDLARVITFPVAFLAVALSVTILPIALLVIALSGNMSSIVANDSKIKYITAILIKVHLILMIVSAAVMYYPLFL